MTERDNREPIEQRHLDFGRAVVALARQYEVRHLKMEFYGGGVGQRWTKVHTQWTMGRPEAANSISFRAEAHHRCDEVAPPRECPSSPDGKHQVDTSMESGPNNCFHCEAPMGRGR